MLHSRRFLPKCGCRPSLTSQESRWQWRRSHVSASVSSRFHAAGQEVFAKVWVPDQSNLATVKMAVGLAVRLQKHDPKPPSDPILSLPTPTPAQWASITAAASKALVAMHWHRHHPKEVSFDREPFRPCKLACCFDCEPSCPCKLCMLLYKHYSDLV